MPNVSTVAEAGFTQVWLPPPADSVAANGYMPRNLYLLDSAYGSEKELRELVQALRDVNVLPVLDAVLNHRCATHKGKQDKWNRWEGTRMDWGEWAICNDNPEYAGSGRSSTGDNFAAAPNIDHTCEKVREDIAAWLQHMISDVGFGGIRFDFSKGYGGNYAGEYVSKALPEFSVGEVWESLAYDEGGEVAYNQDDHRQRIINWVDATNGRSAAFDFTTKGILQEACATSQFWRLVDCNGKAPGVIGYWPERAVTFIDNHDTGSVRSLKYAVSNACYICTVSISVSRSHTIHEKTPVCKTSFKPSPPPPALCDRIDTSSLAVSSG